MSRKKPFEIDPSIHYDNLFSRGIDFKNRVVTLTGMIDTPLFRTIDAAFTELESINQNPITLKINSNGGSVYEALAIVGRIQNSTCNIHTIGYGAIMSAATLILASGNTRSVSKYAWFMLHEAEYSLDAKLSELKRQVNQFDKEESAWATWMTEFTGVEQNYWLRIAVDRDVYLNADEILKLNIVDTII